MPSGPIELHEKWGDPSRALECLALNFRDDKGVIRPRCDSYTMTDDEASAVNYLCMEWDFGYEPAKEDV